MSRKRAAVDQPAREEDDEGPMEALLRVLNETSESRRQLAAHSQAIRDCLAMADGLQLHLQAVFENNDARMLVSTSEQAAMQMLQEQYQAQAAALNERCVSLSAAACGLPDCDPMLPCLTGGQTVRIRVAYARRAMFVAHQRAADAGPAVAPQSASGIGRAGNMVGLFPELSQGVIPLCKPDLATLATPLPAELAAAAAMPPPLPPFQQQATIRPISNLDRVVASTGASSSSCSQLNQPYAVRAVAPTAEILAAMQAGVDYASAAAGVPPPERAGEGADMPSGGAQEAAPAGSLENAPGTP